MVKFLTQDVVIPAWTLLCLIAGLIYYAVETHEWVFAAVLAAAMLLILVGLVRGSRAPANGSSSS